MSADDVVERVATLVSPHALASTDQDVGFEDLVALAKLFKRPWSYLVIDDAETFPDSGSDNRTFENRRAVTPDLLAELQAADLLLDAAAELFPDTTYTVPAGIGSNAPVGETATATRSVLGVTMTEQLALNDDYAALRRWIGSLHGVGVYVTQRQLKDPTIRAFSKVGGLQALIVVDTGDTPYARIFSALHEYCHITLRSAGICDFDDHSVIERYCNAVAAEVLLPDDLLDQTLGANMFSHPDEAADEALRLLSRQLHVSQAALLIRLRDYGTISQPTYEQMELRRKSRRAKATKPGGLYYPSAINRVGRLFARQVVGAMADGSIDRQDASALLGVGEQNVGKFVAELVKGD
jgi:Zn-dependent peptidase ImmA (M78 family)